MAGAVSFKKPALRRDVLVLFQTPNLDFFLSLLTKSAVLFQIQWEMVMKSSASEIKPSLALTLQCDLGCV